MRKRVQTHGTRLHSDWEGWYLWLLSLIRRAIKEVEWPTKRHTHTHTVLSGDVGVWSSYPQATGVISRQRPNYTPRSGCSGSLVYMLYTNIFILQLHIIFTFSSHVHFWHQPATVSAVLTFEQLEIIVKVEILLVPVCVNIQCWTTNDSTETHAAWSDNL